MSIGWVLHRDWVVVDQSFADELDAMLARSRPAAGSAVVIVARSVRHAPEFVLRVVGHPVVVIAESYDGNDGAIDTSGTDGTPASALSLFALAATNVRLLARGGAGTDGCNGGAGALVTFRAFAPTGINAPPELSGRGGTPGVGGTAGAAVTPSLSWYGRGAEWRCDVDAILGSGVAVAA